MICRRKTYDLRLEVMPLDKAPEPTYTEKPMVMSVASCPKGWAVQYPDATIAIYPPAPFKPHCEPDPGTDAYIKGSE